MCAAILLDSVGGSLNAGAIAGGVIGVLIGVILAIIIVVVIIFALSAVRKKESSGKCMELAVGSLHVAIETIPVLKLLPNNYTMYTQTERYYMYTVKNAV